MNSFEEVFTTVKKYCLENGKIPPIGLDTWIEPLVPVSFNGSDAVFKVETEFQKNIVMTTYNEILKGRGTQFNAQVVDAFEKSYPEINKVRQELQG